MKKSCITFLLSGIIILSALFCTVCFTQKAASVRGVTAEYLRIHIRADSNDAAAQRVKYEVRDAVVEFLVPVIAYARDKEEAKAAIRKNFDGVERAAERVLSKNGFSYGARAELKKEWFPTRVYDGVTLPDGEYESLILRLGKGEGDNWWCVAYPPLCFSTYGGQNIAYKSWIVEKIAEWKKGE